ncbi:MAG: adenylate/guanylate cyclase [Polaromonas sp.]|nr:adenylate/guanylate cyclase [Polaromonas sp.]
MRLHRNFLTKGVEAGLVLAFIFFALTAWLINPEFVQRQRSLQFDQFQRWHLPVERPSSVRIIDIDEASLKKYGQWPWPRTRLAELVESLHAAGAKVIVLDILLTEPDRTAPRAMAKMWQNEGVAAALAGLPDHDELFSRSMAGRGVVLGSSLSNSAPDASPADRSKLPYRIVNKGSVANPAKQLPVYSGGIWPLPIFLNNASGVGALNFFPDKDNVVRRVSLFLSLNEQIVPTLSAEALRVAQGARNYLLRSDESGLVEAKIGAITIPLDPQGDIWLDFGRAPAAVFIPAMHAMAGNLDVDALRGRIVLVGSSAAGLIDLRANSLGQLMPGVQAHAVALDQMLSGQSLQRPAWASGAEALALLGGALLVGLVALRAPLKWSVFWAVVVLAVIGAGAWHAFAHEHLLLDAANPALAVLMSFGLASSLHHFASEREQRWIRQAFSRYISPNRVAHLMANPDQLQLGGQRQECSFVFTDLANFTDMIESSDPAHMVAMINDYLESMLEIVFKHEGTLDRIMGDALVVMFSAPIAQLDYRQRALDCALDMHIFASAYADEYQAQGMAWGYTRIGVHCGEVIVGNFGGKTLFDYRALGDPINTAARLETVNKHLGTRVCISQAIVDGCPGLAARPVGRLMLKGKNQWISAYEPVAATQVEDCAPLTDYAEAMQLLQSGNALQAASALEKFEALATRYPHDPLVNLHVQRLRQGAMDDHIILSKK